MYELTTFICRRDNLSLSIIGEGRLLLFRCQDSAARLCLDIINRRAQRQNDFNYDSNGFFFINGCV